MRVMFRGACAASVAGASLIACGSAEAGLTYVSQDRQVQTYVGTTEFPPPAGSPLAEDIEVATDFGTFDATAEVSYEDESDGDITRGSASQVSTLGENGFTARGALNTLGDDRAVARALFSVVFDVSADANYDLDLDVPYSEFTAGLDDELFRFRLARNEDGGGETVLAEEIFTREDPILEFDRSGQLEAGRYTFALDVRAGNTSGGGGSEQGAYDLSFTTTDIDDGNGGGGGSPNPIPLPPAAWAGLATFACYGASRVLTRRLRRA